MYLLWFQDCTGIDLLETRLFVKIEINTRKAQNHDKHTTYSPVNFKGVKQGKILL